MNICRLGSVQSAAMARIGVLLALCLAQPATPADQSMTESETESACLPLLRALANARDQPQLAQFLVDADLRRLEVMTQAFRIGDLVHEVEDGVMRTRRLDPGQDLLSDALKVDMARGNAWCRVDGVERFQGAEMTRISFRHPELDSSHQPVTVLIDNRSWLPRWHGYPSMPGGFAWEYGGANLH